MGNRTEKNTRWSALLLLLTGILLWTGCSANNAGGTKPSGGTDVQSGAQAIAFTDLAGRDIRLDKRPDTFVVANYIANFMMVGGASSLDRVVGMTLDGWKDTRYGEYDVFTKAFPRMAGGKDAIPSIGGYHDNILNAERILSLTPDVILMNNGQFAENSQTIAAFERAGIQVVVLDYHAQRLENHTKSTEILGKLLGREQVAKEQNDAYASAIRHVQETIAALPQSQKGKKVYVELGNKGVGEYGNSYNNSMLWGAIVHQLGAVNLGQGLSAGYGVLDKEFVLSSNPDVVFIGGSVWAGDLGGDQMRMGFTVDDATARKRLNGFAERNEWKQMKAVQNGQVYGVDHGSLRNMIDYTFTQYIAKVLYPEAFRDLDPARTIAEYYKKYLPELSYTGVFMTALDETAVQ